jgi:hypothetical protein
MLDWQNEIREKLAELRLAPTRENEIVEELAQYLAACYEELLASGATREEARSTTLAELNESDLLARELNKVERPVSQEPLIPGARRINLLGDLFRDCGTHRGCWSSTKDSRSSWFFRWLWESAQTQRYSVWSMLYC